GGQFVSTNRWCGTRRRRCRNPKKHYLTMVIHTGGEKPRGARTDFVTDDRGNSPKQFNSKDVPQFAPNFSVYLLPHDVVCLYSEHRKFFLHGELYCALAAAIGAGKRYRDIFRELTPKFPAGAIDEALRRLIERRYVVTAARDTAATAAAYWT